MNAIMNVKGRQTKLLAAIAVMAMVICAFAVVTVPADAATPDTPTEADTKLIYGTAVDMDQDAWDALKATTPATGATTTYDSTNKVIKLTANTTWNLTEDVVDDDVTIDLNGFNLKITGGHSLTITNNAANDNGGYIAALTNESTSTKSNIMIDGATASFIGNGTRAGGVWAVDAAMLNQVYLVNQATLEASKTATSAVTGTVWCGDNGNVVIFADNSTVKFSNAHTNGAGVSKTAIFAYNNSTIDATGLASGSLSVYADLDDSTINGNIVGLYGATLTGTSSVTANTLGVYSGDADSAFQGFTLNNVEVGAESSVSAETIVNSLTTGTSAGTNAVNFTGQGTISGEFTEITGSTSNYNVNGVTLSNVTAGTGVAMTIGADGVVAEGTVDLTGVEITSTGKIVASGNAIVTVDDDTAIFDSKTDIINTTEKLVTAAKAENQTITFTPTGNLTLNSDLIIGAGTTITQTNGYYVDIGTKTISSNGNSSVEGLKVFDDTNGTNLFVVTLNGSFEISQGSIYVNGVLTDDNEVALRNGNIVISGSLSGNLTFTEEVDANDTAASIAPNTTVTFEDFTVNAGAVVEFLPDDNVTYQTKGDFVLYGSLISDSNVTLNVGFADVTGANPVDNHSDFVAYAGAVIQQSVTLVAYDSDSTITLDDSLRTMEISVDVTGHQVYSQMQTVVIVTSLEITSYSTLEIRGQLVINEGVTLTIEENGTLLVDSATAQMIVNGQITVLGGGQIVVADADSVDVAGTIESDGTVMINSTVTVEENGSILIDNTEGSSIVVTDGLTINAGGELTVRGEMSVNNITNKGTVTLNGAVLTSYPSTGAATITGTKITLAADGATVNITSFYSEAVDNTLTITDAGLVLYDDTSADNEDIIVGTFNEASTERDYTGTNTVTLKPTYAMTGIRNLVISETVTSTVENRVTYYDYGMNISGTPAVVDERVAGNGQTLDPENATYEIAVAGVDMRVAAETELTLGARVTLAVNDVTTPVAKDGVLNVAGTVYAINTDAEIDNTATINVTGMIESTGMIAADINAAHYEATVDGNTRNYYTTLNTAVANGATDIDVLGEITILENLIIPNGVTVRGTSTSVMSIGNEDNRDVVVTVESGATVRNFNNSTGGIIVDGTLEFADSNSSKSNRIVSDVSVANSPAVSYTNIYTALQNAESGETVTITRDAQFGPVELTDDIAVGEGVTLVIPNARSVQVNDGVQLTVDGTVQVIGTIVSESGYDGFNPLNSDDTEKDADEYGIIIVNGTMMSLSRLPYAAVPGTGAAGEYGYYIAGAYYQIVNSSGSYYYITPVEQAGVVSNDVREGAIEIYGENTAGDVTFTGDSATPVTVTVTAGSSLEASSVTLSYAEMNINVDGAFTGTVSSAVGSVELQNVADMSVSSHFDDETEVLSIEGVPEAADTEADVSVAIASGAVTIDGHINDGDFNAGLLDDFTIASGATLTVTGSGVVLSTGEMTVDGTLVATDNGSINATTMIVRGTLTVEPRTDDHAAGSAEITKLYVGITYNEDNNLELIDASAATVTADAIRNLGTVIVSADSTVTGDLVTDMDSTEFYVEDALWITVYGAGDIVTGTAANPVYNYQPGDLTESKFTAWTDADGTNVPAGTAIGAPGCEQVYANINYDVYIVIIMTDNSIGSVAIDGQMLVNTGIGFVLPGNYDIGTGIGAGLLDAGEHTITYTLAGGYEGTATLTSNGVNATVSGMTFTLSGDFEDANNVPNVNYLTLGGATYSGNTVVIDGGNGGSNDMGLTDYLLIVLVILIVIMAIIVALRLMRS